MSSLTEAPIFIAMCGSLGFRLWLLHSCFFTAGAGGTGCTATTGPGGARTRGTGAAKTGGVGFIGAGDPTERGAAGTGGTGAGGAGAGGAQARGPGARGAEAGGARAVDPGALVAGARAAGGIGAGGTMRPRPFFPLLQPASPLRAPSPYTEQSGGLIERRERASRPVLPVRTAHRVPRSRSPPVPGTHAMALRPSSVPLRAPLPAPPESSLPAVPNPGSDLVRAAIPTVSCLLAIVVTDPSFQSATASALVAERLDIAVACHLDYATALIVESESASPLSVRAAVPHFASMLLALEGDPDAPDILTPRSYAEAITCPYSSQWQAAMDAEMASWKSTGTYVDEVPPPGANIVDGMWIFRVKRPSGSLPAFKVRYIARGFSQRQGVDYFQTFSATPKMTILRVLHEEIWLRRPPGFTGSFPAGTQWSLPQPVYGLRQAPREWHDTLRTTLAALGFAPSTADPSLFLRTDTSLPLFYILVYVDDLVFATADTEALTLVKSELQKRHTCTDLAPPSDESVELSGPYPELVGCLIMSGMGLMLGGQGPVVLTGHADAFWVDDSATQRSSQGYTFSLGSGSVSWRSTRSSSVLSSSCEAEIYVRAMAA
ncbi:unnamed protein product [Closterium sp. NIES-53]